MTPTPVAACPTHLVDLAHRRWTLPVLASLHHARRSGDPTGARFAGLAHTLEVSRESLRQTLDFATAHGWLKRNPGHGHPLRPEFILTARGRRLAPECERVLSCAADLSAAGAIGRKWSIPILCVLAEGPHRFGEIKNALEEHGATDRALAATLRALHEAALISRRVVHERPPGVRYTLHERAAPLARAVRSLAESAA